MKKVDKSSSAGTKVESSTNAQVEQVSQHSSNEMLPAVWLNVKERLPETPFGKEFNYSDFKAVKCKKELYPTTARFEKGEGWQQWYCPLTDDTVEVEFWIDLPDLPKSGNSRYWKTKSSGDEYTVNCDTMTIEAKYSKRAIKFSGR